MSGMRWQRRGQAGLLRGLSLRGRPQEVAPPPTEESPWPWQQEVSQDLWRAKSAKCALARPKLLDSPHQLSALIVQRSPCHTASPQVVIGEPPVRPRRRGSETIHEMMLSWHNLLHSGTKAITSKNNLFFVFGMNKWIWTTSLVINKRVWNLTKPIHNPDLRREGWCSTEKGLSLLKKSKENPSEITGRF